MKYLLLPLLLLFTSCVKDVDFDQYSEIAVSPTVAIDLVYVSLSTPDFMKVEAAAPLSFKEEVQLDFEEYDFIQKDLVKIQLEFNYLNTFPQKFQSTIRFMAGKKTVKYTVPVEIPAGSPLEPQVIELVEVIEGKELEIIKHSSRMTIELEMEPNTQQIEGELELRAKALYTFEL